MIDPTPDYRNRLAYLVSLLFHPFVIAVPTLVIVLSKLHPGEIIRWSALVVLVLILPAAVALVWLRRRGRHSYQRQNRGLLFLIGWLSILVYLGLAWAWDAPQVIFACMGALAVWVPLHAAINHFFTKASIHMAVVTGCLTGLLMLGKLDHPILLALAITAIALTAWSRIVTRNHTPAQVLLGIAAGSLPVLIIFPLVSGA